MMFARSNTTSLLRAVAQERTTVYLELTKPRITLMVLLTVAIGFMLAPVNHGAWALVHVLIGTALSCSGAGALNQYIERSADRVMARTRFRPLPSRRVAPATAALVGFALAATGVAYLAWTTNGTAAGIDACTLIAYLMIYTPLKAHSALSTPVGAIPGALPPVIGWTAATGTVDNGAAVLFAILFLWQIPHFLAIGRLYRDDYARAGFPMLVVLDRDGTIVGRQMILYSAVLMPFAVAPTLIGLTRLTYAAVALVAGAGYLLAAIVAARRPSHASSRTLLIASILYLPALFAAMFVDRLVG